STLRPASSATRASSKSLATVISAGAAVATFSGYTQTSQSFWNLVFSNPTTNLYRAGAGTFCKLNLTLPRTMPLPTGKVLTGNLPLATVLPASFTSFHFVMTFSIGLAQNCATSTPASNGSSVVNTRLLNRASGTTELQKRLYSLAVT